MTDIDLRTDVPIAHGSEFFHGFGTFWATKFGDAAVSQTIADGLQDRYNQALITLEEAVATETSVSKAPLYHTEVWYPLFITPEDVVVTNPNTPFFSPSTGFFGSGLVFGVGVPTLWSVAVPKNLVDPKCILSSLRDPAYVGYRNQAFFYSNGILGFRVNPFADPRFPTVVTDQGKGVILWLYISAWDNQTIAAQYGPPLGLPALPSTEAYRTLCDGAWQNRVYGACNSALYKVVAGATGVPLCRSPGETVEVVTTSPNGDLCIVTDAGVYRFPSSHVPTVDVGDILGEGQALTDAMYIKHGASLQSGEEDIEIPPGFFNNTIRIKEPIRFPNKQVPVTPGGLTANGNRVVTFPLGGLGSDLTKWRGAANSAGLYKAFDIRGPNAPTVPTPTQIRPFINPAVDLIAKHTKPHLLLLYGDQSRWPASPQQQAVLLSQADKVIPVHGRLIQQVGPAVVPASSYSSQSLQSTSSSSQSGSFLSSPSSSSSGSSPSSKSSKSSVSSASTPSSGSTLSSTSKSSISDSSSSRSTRSSVSRSSSSSISSPSSNSSSSRSLTSNSSLSSRSSGSTASSASSVTSRSSNSSSSSSSSNSSSSSSSHSSPSSASSVSSLSSDSSSSNSSSSNSSSSNSSSSNSSSSKSTQSVSSLSSLSSFSPFSSSSSFSTQSLSTQSPSSQSMSSQSPLSMSSQSLSSQSMSSNSSSSNLAPVGFVGGAYTFGSSEIFHSHDGFRWHTSSMPVTTGRIFGMAWDSTHSKYIAVRETNGSGLAGVYGSSDGKTFTHLTDINIGVANGQMQLIVLDMPGQGGVAAVVAGPSNSVSTAMRKVFASTDGGSTWTFQGQPPVGISGNVNPGNGTDGTTLVHIDGGGSQLSGYYSTDFGVTWSTFALPFALDEIPFVGYISGEWVIAAVVYSPSVSPILWTTANIATATPSFTTHTPPTLTAGASPARYRITGIAKGASKYALVSGAGEIQYGSDLDTWTAWQTYSSAFTALVYDSLGGNFVAANADATSLHFFKESQIPSVTPTLINVGVQIQSLATQF